jgi:localization factor PodJL
MTSGAAWSTRPFRPETLEAAREAARRSGLSLAEWLNSAILDTAADAGVRACRRGFHSDDLGPEEDALTALGERLDELALRIDRLTKRGNEPEARRPGSPSSRSAPEITTSLHAIKARLASIVRELVPQSQAATQRLADVTRNLNSGLDRLGAMTPASGDIAPHAAAADRAPGLPDQDGAKPRERTAGLGNALAEISARQRELDAEIAGAQDFSRLEQQLRHITEQIETLRRPANTADAAATWGADRTAFERIESKIIELAQKLDASDARLDSLGAIERSMVDVMFQLKETRAAAVETLRRPANTADAAAISGADRTAFERIESRILELAQKLDASDARLDSLGAIERSMVDLMFQLKETRAAAVEEAERAARAVAGEMLADSGATAIEIDALKQELVEFRAGQAEIDHRTADALEAVHDTLERLVDRLASVETGVRAGARTSVEPQETRVLSGSRSDSGSAAPALNRPAPKLAPEHRPIDADLPADYPLEPGSGAPRGRTPSSAATRIAASEAVVTNPAPAEPAAKANFIAAARRAAQAAAAEGTDPADPAGVRSQASSGIGAAVANRRRPLMIAAGVLLFGAGSLHVVVNGHLLPLPRLNDSVRTEAPGSASEETLSPAANAKPLAAPAPSEARAALAPDPVVPESGPPAARQPSSATGDEFLLSPVPDRSVLPAADPQLPERVLSGPAPTPVMRTGEVTGSLPPPQADAATLASQPAARKPAPNAAETLPNAIGNAALRSAAVAGNPAAEYEIGVRFIEGRGVPQSFEAAAHWLARAAEHGLAPAQYRLGSLYEKGQGVKKDLMEACRLYVTAAQQGNAKAMHNLAVLYAVGLEGAPDYKIASEWFQKAADHGVADSQYNLGILYARGVGVEQNLAESYKWFALAAQQGDKDAAKKRDEVAARLDPQALVAARLAVKTWTADPEPDKATKVEPPGGDKDRALPIAPSAKSKPGRRTGAAGSA